MKRFYKRRYRQIGRLLYYYCCVRYMTRKDGRWVETMAECPVCDGDGEFLTDDDVYTCSVCGGSGQISTLRRVKWIKEMENMKKYKAYLTMEFTADVQASDEDSARDTLAEFIQNGYKPFYSPVISNIKLARYWGGGNEILNDGKVVVR